MRRRKNGCSNEYNRIRCTDRKQSIMGLCPDFSAGGNWDFFTFRLGFVQIRKFGSGLKKMFGNFSLHGKDHKDGLSSFQALTTAIAAQVGTGNIAGAATALASGGPGAIFWMWVSAFFGMATIYAEAIMAQKTRQTKDGQLVGGPVYYIRYIFKGKFGRFRPGFSQWLLSLRWASWGIWFSQTLSECHLQMRFM